MTYGLMLKTNVFKITENSVLFQAAIFKYVTGISAESESVQLLPVNFIRIFAHSQ